MRSELKRLDLANVRATAVASLVPVEPVYAVPVGLEPMA